MEQFNIIANNLTTLVAFIGGRYIISEIYDEKKDYFTHPIIKILLIISILFINIKDFKITIIIFFIYLLFIENTQNFEDSEDSENIIL